MGLENIAPNIFVKTSNIHRFGTDAVLLTRFSRYRERDRVCDLGTGCGIIPLLMQQGRPPREIYAVDIQADAIALLEESLKYSTGIVSQIQPICADLCQLWDDAPRGVLDLVTCNPPYKLAGTGQVNLSPNEAITRHEIACTIYDVCNAAHRLLHSGGRLCVCNRPERLSDTITAMRTAKIEPKRLQFVTKSHDHAPWLFLLEGRLGGGNFLEVLPEQVIQAGSPVSTQKP